MRNLICALFLLWLGVTGFAQSRSVIQHSIITLPDSPNAYGNLEVRACPLRDAIGGAITPCEGANRLAGYSAGKSCITGVTYQNGIEQMPFTRPLCVRDCTITSLSPKDESCEKSIYKEYAQTTAWRSLGALPAESRERLLALYRELILLVTADSQDARRVEVKRSIVGIVVREMIPFRYNLALMKAKDPAMPDNYHFPNQFWREGDKVEEFSPMEIRTDQELYVYESALLERKGNAYTIRHPDDLALDLLHEMVHFLQQGFGYGESKFTFRSPMHLAQMYLFELNAYQSMLDNTYAKILANEHHPLPDKIPAKLAAEFAKTWRELTVDDQRYLARWAWALPDGWMRSLMFAHPNSNGGIWGMLCSSNTGRGPCGMER